MKRRFMFRALAVLILGLITSFLTGPKDALADNAKRKVIKLRVAAGHPYATAIWVQTINDFFIPEVKKRVLDKTSAYAIECTGYYGGSLAKLGEELEAVNGGITDIMLVHNVFEQAKLEVFNFPWWPPFVSTDCKQVVKATDVVMQKNPIFKDTLAKYNQRQIGKSYNNLSAFELITKFPITTMNDLKGRKIAHGGSMIPWIKALGGVGVQSTFNDAYTSIDTGVYEGWIMPADTVVALKLYEVAPNFTQVGFGAFVNGYLTINLSTWNALPPEVQKIIDEVGNEYTWELVKRNVASESAAIEKMKAGKCKVNSLSKEERAAWASILYNAGVAQAAAKRADEHGLPGTKVLKEYIEALKADGYVFPFNPNF